MEEKLVSNLLRLTLNRNNLEDLGLTLGLFCCIIKLIKLTRRYIMNINGIEYKEIPGFPDYYAGYDGSIYSIKSNKIMKVREDRTGYLKVGIRNKDGKQLTRQVQRYIASAWIPNPDNKPQVHHKDENKHNNSVDNLAWVTSKENNNLGTRTERMAKTQTNSITRSKPVILTNLEDTSQVIFPSVNEAMRHGFKNISKVLRGEYKQCMGYTAEYLKKEEN